MSKDEIAPEYKTIRISASSYYKLVELAGIVSAVSGTNFSLTYVADMVINGIYQLWYPEYLKIANNPEAMKKTREELQKNLKQIFELYKGVKIIK